MNTTHLSHISWRSYGRAVLAIAKKDAIHFFRYPLQAVSRIIEPLAWLTPFYFLGKTFAGPEGNSGFAAYTGSNDYMTFILIGALLSNYIAAVFWGMGLSLKQEMDSGVLETNWMTPIPRSLFLVGQTIANMVITTINAFSTLFLAWLLFGFQLNGNLLLAFLVMMPLLLALYGFGFAFAAIVLTMRDANTLIDVSNYLLSLLSGSQFPVSVLPRYLLPISLAIPLTYGFDAIRGLLMGTNTILPIVYEIGLLILFMLITVPIGYLIFKAIERRAQRLGTLSMH